MAHTQAHTESAEREGDSATRAEVFDAVKNLRRRYALYYLKQRRCPVELGELAEQVAAWENDTTVERITSEQRKSVYSALYQTHLPKLEDAGIVEYDRGRGLVSFSKQGKDLDLRLASDPQTTVAWNQWYLGLSAAGLTGMLFVVLGTGPFSMISELIWAGLMLSAFFLLSISHSYDLRRWRRRFDGAAPDFLLEME